MNEYIKDVDINNTTPLEALNFLAMLKQELQKAALKEARGQKLD